MLSSVNVGAQTVQNTEVIMVFTQVLINVKSFFTNLDKMNVFTCIKKVNSCRVVGTQRNLLLIFVAAFFRRSICLEIQFLRKRLVQP